MTTNVMEYPAVSSVGVRPFIAKNGRPTSLVNETKWRVLFTLADYERRYPPVDGTRGLTSAEIAHMAGLTLTQVKGTLATRYMTRNGERSLVFVGEGAATGNRTLRYVISDRGRRWLQWAANTGYAHLFTIRWQEQRAHEGR